MLRLSTPGCYDPVVPRARAYHHGNLKEALLSAAVGLIAECGPAGFTLREVARRAGVSHNAPYRHYKDRDELLAEVARRGFEELGKALQKDLAAAGADPIARFRAIGQTYVRFALKRPEHFAVMFDHREDPDPYPQRETAGLATFGVLFEVLMECQAQGLMPPGDPERLALKGWSLVHGLAKLALAGFLKMQKTSDVLAFADEATLSGLHGLLATRPPAVVPVLPYPDVREAVAWLTRAFGFEGRLPAAGQRAQMVAGDGGAIVVESGERNRRSPGHQVMVRVANVNEHCERARRYGADVLQPPADHPSGERRYVVRDPGGHRWTFFEASKGA